MNPKIPTEYMHKQIEREKRQDELMAARGWVKVQDGMWEKKTPIPDAVGAQ